MVSYRVLKSVTVCPLLGMLGCLSGVPALSQELKQAFFLPPNGLSTEAGISAGTFSPLSDLFSRERPTALDPQFPPKPTPADARMKRAEDLFQQGRRLYQEGDQDGARRNFDSAIDILLNTKGAPSDEASFDKQFERMVQAIYRYDLEGLGGGEVNQDPGYDKAPLDDILNLTFPLDPRLKNKVREELAATVSQLPLETSDAVLSYINFFSGQRGKRVIAAGIRRQGRYKPLISRILAEEGVPQELIFLAQAESGFLPRAVSYKAAGGMWQFVKFRGREYGLMQTPYSDDRFDPEKATRAAARHLRDLYNQFGDWYLAIAGYNCGPGTVDRAVQKTGYADVWELRNRGALPKETSNYVPIIVAMTIMAKNAKDYGLDDAATDPPIEYDTVELSAMTNIPLIADILGVPVAEIRELNPALLKNLTPAGYQLHIPKGSASYFVATLDIIPVEQRKAWRLYRVEADEALGSVCQRYGVTVAAVRKANTANLLLSPQPGDLLVMPAVYREPVAKASKSRGKTPSRASAKPAAQRTPAKASAKPATPSSSPRPAPKSGTVAKSLRPRSNS